jgi:hypothetical protein
MRKLPLIPAPLAALFVLYAANTTVSKAAIEYFAPADATNRHWVRGHQIEMFEYTDALGRKCSAFMPKVAVCFKQS